MRVELTPVVWDQLQNGTGYPSCCAEMIMTVTRNLVAYNGELSRGTTNAHGVLDIVRQAARHGHDLRGAEWVGFLALYEQVLPFADETGLPDDAFDPSDDAALDRAAVAEARRAEQHRLAEAAVAARSQRITEMRDAAMARRSKSWTCLGCGATYDPPYSAEDVDRHLVACPHIDANGRPTRRRKPTPSWAEVVEERTRR